MIKSTARLLLILAACVLTATAFRIQEPGARQTSQSQIAIGPTEEREAPEVYQGRRASVQERLNDGIVVLFGNTENNGAEAYHRFRQESNFYYLTGYNEPGAVLLLVPPLRDHRSPFWEEFSRLPRELLFLPPRDLEQERWTGPKLGPYDPAAPAQTGFSANYSVVKGTEQLAKEIRQFEKGYPVVYTLLPDPHGYGAEEGLEKENLEKLRTLLPFANFKDVRRALGALRQVKSQSELSLIQRAMNCTIDGLQATTRELRPGLFEYEIAALLKYTFEREGCLGLAFDPIVGSGPRSTVLHYTRNDGHMDAGDLAVVDVGADYGHYASDITRTFPVSGRFTPRQREIYEIVLEAQKAALQAVKPGMRMSGRGSDSLYQIAYNYINTHGKDRHGNSLGKYFIHGLSHHVGLDVHDAGDFTVPLEEGMVITVEPGIYLPEENLGVRIEDMVLVTKTGYVLLTAKLPREVDEIEGLLKK